MFLGFILSFLGSIPMAEALTVSLVTPKETKVLKVWSHAELKKLAKARGAINPQKLLFEESTQGLDLNTKADIDLITLKGSGNELSQARVPRFMVWRGFLSFTLNPDGTLRSQGDPNRLLIPREFFTLSRIENIELSRASTLYPNTKLMVRTNPAASRGEKLYTQSCLACHSLRQPSLPVSKLIPEQLSLFDSKHQGLKLDAKGVRGLIAYREALEQEQGLVKSKK